MTANKRINTDAAWPRWLRAKRYYENIDLIGTVGCGIRCLSATLWHGGSRRKRNEARQGGPQVISALGG